ncbi:FtsB family cell division protein [Nocardioides aurantiacus]|uniref:FtsB family cell division protein n=1 Tax=Nocardioides aurantiacus TaxID=86796 RepID=UPI00403F78F9
MATRHPQRGSRRSTRQGRPASTPRHLPGNLRPGATGGTRERQDPRAPRPRFTQRMAVLVLVVAVLVVSYASSMRAFLDQRSHIAELRDQISASEREISGLEREKRRWADDAYVEAQARERFGWVMPGETSYQVIDRDGKPLERTDELTDPDSVEEEVTDAWWDKVWGSVETADHPERVETPPSQLETPEQRAESGS